MTLFIFYFVPKKMLRSFKVDTQYKMDKNNTTKKKKKKVRRMTKRKTKVVK